MPVLPGSLLYLLRVWSEYRNSYERSLGNNDVIPADVTSPHQRSKIVWPLINARFAKYAIAYHGSLLSSSTTAAFTNCICRDFVTFSLAENLN